MTLIISMVTKKGIFNISDMRITSVEGDGRNLLADEQEKFLALNRHVILVFWGWTGNEKPSELRVKLEKFKQSVKENDSATEVAKMLRVFCSREIQLCREDPLGFHVFGIENEQYILHHVFFDHTSKNGRFIDENSLEEFHQFTHLGFIRIARLTDYPIIFNGDNKLVNLIINGLQSLGDVVPYYDFEPWESKNFLKFLMETAIDLQRFSENSREDGPLIGYPLNLWELVSRSLPFKSIIHSDCKNRKWNKDNEFCLEE